MRKIKLIQDFIDSDLDTRSYIRARARCKGDRYPIVVVAGNAEPQVTGEGAHYTNKSGERIHYPNAYKWFKIYRPSTIRLEVTIGWLEQIRPSFRKYAGIGEQLELNV